MTEAIILKDRICDNCGTDLEWWFYKKRKPVFRLPSDEYFCSKKCVREYRTYEQIEEIKPRKEAK